MIAKFLIKLRPLAPVVLRIAVGIGFIYHGGQKLFGLWDGPGIQGVMEMTEKMGFYPPNVWAYLLAVTEFFGGVALIFGALTAYAAFGLAIAMAVAFFVAHDGMIGRSLDGRGGGELAFVYLLACISLIFSGPGVLALDNFLKAPEKKTGKESGEAK
ncbi:MAG: DoxX family protein [bacterium]|jgi:putative oxidoreductase